jgi:Holliday junction DNA helicase RuvA
VIGRLEGRLQRIDPGTVIVDAHGVGYLVATTLRSLSQVADGDTAVLWIHTHVRDDAIVLYGFHDRRELLSFEQLISVAGVGPRTALAILSALDAGELALAVESGDLVRLQRTPGIGRKTAERILLELRGRLDLEPEAGTPGDLRSDAASALVNLGYPDRDARRAVDDVLAGLEQGGDLGEVLRLALQRLTR